MFQFFSINIWSCILTKVYDFFWGNLDGFGFQFYANIILVQTRVLIWVCFIHHGIDFFINIFY
ncbi:hypothetical protein DB895_12090 [Flavobacterium psychrotolerans]|uniref:Uncharacterized protein n=1 Tax=Flavobacterium psychrotolerans TaxID=2169410 RepID=A0A2U1JGU5_9FLAO|nr:hypothetical protein DB895_12090 [Flavobacterium psychrotolerans]